MPWNRSCSSSGQFRSFVPSFIRSFRFSRSQRVARNRVLYTYDRRFSMLTQRKSFPKKRRSSLYALPDSLLCFLAAIFQNVLPKCFGFHFPFYARNTPLYYNQKLWLLLSAGTRTIPAASLFHPGELRILRVSITSHCFLLTLFFITF